MNQAFQLTSSKSLFEKGRCITSYTRTSKYTSFPVPSARQGGQILHPGPDKPTRLYVTLSQYRHSIIRLSSSLCSSSEFLILQRPTIVSSCEPRSSLLLSFHFSFLCCTCSFPRYLVFTGIYLTTPHDFDDTKPLLDLKLAFICNTIAYCRST